MSISSAIYRRWRKSGSAVSLHAAICLLLFLGAGPVLIAAEEFLVRSWHLEDGLPDGNITAIQQTPDGYLWLGTPKGLVRFDGARFKWFEASHTPALRDGSISGLLVDRRGKLWINFASGNLVVFAGGQFRRVNVSDFARNSPGAGFIADESDEPNRSTRWMWGRVANMAEDAEGAVWTLKAGGGLVCCRGEQATLFTPTNGLPNGEISGLCSDESGRTWLVAGNSLHFFHEGQWVKPQNGAPLGGSLPRIAKARAGGIWVAAPRESWIKGGGTIRRFKDDQWLGGPEPPPWTPNSLRSQVTTLIEDHSGRIWLGTLWGGVLHSDSAGRWLRLRNEGPFSQCVITCLFEDRQGAIWVGTVGEGLHQVTQRPVTMLTLPAPAQNNIITASCATRDGSVWVGTDGTGAFRYRRGAFIPFGAKEGLSSLHVCSLLEDRGTNLWSGTWGGLFNFEQGHFARVEGPPELGLAVLALFEDRATNLWIGTPRGLICRHGREFSVHRLVNEERDLDVRSIAEDLAGDIWAGTIGSGLFRLRGDLVERVGPVQGFPSANARSLFCDSTGALWVGSDGAGLFRLADGSFTAYTSADGLPSDTISSITPDDEGTLWMGSDNGIFGCAPAGLTGYKRGHSPALLGVRLGLAEGLGSRGCSGSGQPVASRSADGRLWFPNMRGLAVFNPRAVAAERQAPEVVVESVIMDGVELPERAGERRAPSSARRFEFHYTALDLTSAQSLRFRHKLEGMDSDWVETGAQREVSYSQLPPGDYKFRVMSGGADGRWHEGAKPILIRVVPRLWELPWFRVLSGFLLVTGVAGAIVLNERHKLRRRLERLELQQALENERRRIARDLHDDLGARLTEIVLLGELAKRGEQTPSVLQHQVGGMTQKVRQLIAVMEEVVWTVNPKNDSLPNLAAYLSDYTERFLAPAQMSCRLDVDDDLPQVPLTAQVRHNLLLAVKEALNNAARHAAAAKVRLRIHRTGTSLCVGVEDDGQGFDVAHPAHAGNGLQNMQTRLASVGGKTEIHSVPGRGTTVTFSLPLPAAATGK